MLDQSLENYSGSDVYPFHMPGHKRQPFDFPNPYTVDVTEIEGFDDLHHPTGEIRQIETGFAELYGTRDARLLVNGSTAGVMAAVFAATRPGEEILLARNCHGCAYRAAGLRGLSVHYVYPRMAEDGGTTSGLWAAGEGPALAGEIHPADFLAALKEHPGIRTAVVISPTYDGICSDIPALADIAHQCGVTLIVDAAHGAHLGLRGSLGEKGEACRRTDLSCADFAVVSLHKTLPAFTGTALLLTGATLPGKEKLSYYLDCFQTSSPSYLLMASAAKCLRYLREQGEEAFAAYDKKLDDFYAATGDLVYVTLLHPFCHDRGKLLIGAPPGWTGTGLMAVLREEFHLELEMAAGAYCLAMTSIMDTAEGFVRLSEALHRLERRYRAEEVSAAVSQREHAAMEVAAIFSHRATVAMSLSAAIEAPGREVPHRAAKGCISGGFVSVYPPGIPLLCPGEVITEDILSYLEQCQKEGLTLRGIPGEGSLFVVSPS